MLHESRDCVHVSPTLASLNCNLFRVRMVSLVPEASKVCLARKEMKDPEDSLDLPVQLGCRCVNPKDTNRLHFAFIIMKGPEQFMCILLRACLVQLVRKVKLEMLVRW